MDEVTGALGSVLCSAIVLFRGFGMVTVSQLAIWKMGVLRNKRVKVAEVLSVAGTRHLSKTSNFPDFRDCKDTLIVKSLFYPKQCFSVVENFSL